jgi:predicted nucleic acid-binding protein
VKVLVDTSALLALFDRGEDRHRRARACLQELASARLVVSDYILDEALTRWLTTGRAAAGLAFVDALLQSPRHELVFVDRPVFDLALEKAGKYAEHDLSFTDCTSVVFVETLRLDGIFCFDEGFRRVGVRVLPGPAS